MKVLFLFNRIKRDELSAIKAREGHDGHFFGMFRMRKYGIDARYLELEQYIPRSFAVFLRRHILNIHAVHLPLFPLFLKHDAVFTSTAFGSLFIKAVLHIKKPKWVLLDFNVTGLIGERKTFKQKLLYYLASRTDGVVTISESEENALRALFPHKKTLFLHLGTDIEFFKPQKVPEENFILSIGRDPGRDFKTLFEAVKDLDIEVKITALPNQLKHLEPLPKNVTVHNFTPQELVEQYARAKLVVLPLNIPDHERNNAMGCSTLVEAMAMGKAIVVTRTNTMESYVEDGRSAALVERNNERALHATIERLLRNKDERRKLGENARAFAVEQCSADQFAEKLSSYFTSL